MRLLQQWIYFSRAIYRLLCWTKIHLPSSWQCERILKGGPWIEHWVGMQKMCSHCLKVDHWVDESFLIYWCSKYTSDLKSEIVMGLVNAKYSVCQWQVLQEKGHTWC